jgi:hypothetical protein
MRRTAIGLGMMLAAGATAADWPITERLVPGLGEVDMQINRQPMRWRIDPAAFNIPFLSMEAAKRARLRSGDIALIYAVGPQIVRGDTGLALVDKRLTRTTVAWLPRAYAAGLDGVVGPGGLAEDRIRFVFRMPRPGERTVTLPMIGQDGPLGQWGSLFARIEVGGEPMRVRFDPHHPHTLATANAGQRLAAAYGGGFTGSPFTTEIAFGIERPVRPLRLDRPLAIGPLTLTTLGVRTGDVGSSAAVPDADAPPPDPDEIVVVARGKRHDPDRDRLSLGADVLRPCSTLVFDKRARTISLSCLVPG